MNTQTTGIIRDRGQLTIPENIRNDVSWAGVGSVVTISKNDHNEIVIRPYSAVSDKVDWDKLWEDIKRVRSYKGKNETRSAAKMINEDRKSR